MIKRLALAILAIFLLTGVSYGADIPVTFTFKTAGEADLATWLITEYDEAMTPTSTTFSGTLTGGQIDVASDETLTYPDNAETTKCYTVHVTDTSGNDSAESASVCKRVDEVAPGSCIDFGILDR